EIALGSITDDTYFNLDENNNRIDLIIPEGTNGFLTDFRNNQVGGLLPDEVQTIRNIAQQQERLSENNLIFASNISWIRDSRKTVFDNQFSRIRLKFEVAGNVLSG